MSGKVLTASATIMYFSAVMLFGCAGNRVTVAQEAQAHYKMGLNRMQSGNDEAALYEFNAAIQKDPSNANAHFGAGIIYLKQNAADPAIKEFRKTLSLDPNFADAHNNLGLAYVKKKDYETAIKEFRAATENPLYKTRETALINIGLACDIMGDHERAAQAFREALLVQPENYAAMFYLAGQYYKMNRVDDAIMYYKKSIEMDPGNPNARYELGIVYFKAGRNAEALASFQKAIDLAPGTDIASSSEKYINLLK